MAGGRGYHHGNLPEALVGATLALIAERGPGGFTFAEVARGAGVSAAAPYRHFRDRNALIAEVARRGFEALAATLDAAWSAGPDEPVVAIERCLRAYLAYARREPAYFAAMFEPGFPLEDAPAPFAASERAFAVLRRAAEAACRGLPAAIRPPPLMVALHLWAMAHGIAALFIGRGARRLPMTPEDLLEAGLLVYLHAVGLQRGGL